MATKSSWSKTTWTIVSNAASKWLAPWYALAKNQTSSSSTPTITSASSWGWSSSISQSAYDAIVAQAARQWISAESVASKAQSLGLIPKTTTTGLNSNRTQLNTSDIFGDYGNNNKQQYTGQWLKLSSWKEITNLWNQQLTIPQEINLYGENLKQAEKLNPGTLKARNDALAYNLKQTGVQDKQAIMDYLSKQPWFSWASLTEQQNTVNSIAARMGITKEALTQEDLLKAEQDKLFETYQKEQWDLQTEWDKQAFVKRMDNLLGNQVRTLTDSEVQQLADQTGLSYEDARQTADEWAIARQKVYEPFQQQEEDLTKNKDRAIQDAQTQLQRAKETVNNNIDDTRTNMLREVAGYEKIGALKGYIQSTGYQNGIETVRTDAQKAIDRLNQQLNEASADTAQYISRTTDDFTTNMSRLQLSFNDSLLNLRQAGTNEVNSLLSLYSPSDDIMTKEIDRITQEYGMKSMDLVLKRQEASKWIIDNAMYQAEKIQTYQAKQQELENNTLNYLYQNNWMALRNMTDADINSLYQNGYISADQVWILKSARAWAIQDYWLNQAYKQSQTILNQSKAGTPIQNIGNIADSVSAIPDWDYRWDRWDCVAFVNDVLEQNGYPAFSRDTDQSISNKISHKNSNTPTVWSVLIRTSPTQPEYGDVVIVTWINWNTISYKWCNRNGDHAVYSGTIDKNDKSIKWYYDPTLTTDADKIADAIISGKQSPDLKGMYWKAAAVKVALAKKWYDQAKALSDRNATQKYLTTLNGQQQIRLRQAVTFVDESLWLLDNLNTSADAALKRSWVTNFAKVQKNAALSWVLWQEVKSVFTQLVNQISDMQSELSVVYKGGTSPTDESLKQAQSMLNSNRDYKTLKDNINLIRKNMQIRINSLNTATVVWSSGQYLPNQWNIDTSNNNTNTNTSWWTSRR